MSVCWSLVSAVIKKSCLIFYHAVTKYFDIRKKATGRLKDNVSKTVDRLGRRSEVQCWNHSTGAQDSKHQTSWIWVISDLKREGAAHEKGQTQRGWAQIPVSQMVSTNLNPMIYVQLSVKGTSTSWACDLHSRWMTTNFERVKGLKCGSHPLSGRRKQNVVVEATYPPAMIMLNSTSTQGKYIACDTKHNNTHTCMCKGLQLKFAMVFTPEYDVLGSQIHRIWLVAKMECGLHDDRKRKIQHC